MFKIKISVGAVFNEEFASRFSREQDGLQLAEIQAVAAAKPSPSKPEEARHQLRSCLSRSGGLLPRSPRDRLARTAMARRPWKARRVGPDSLCWTKESHVGGRKHFCVIFHLLWRSPKLSASHRYSSSSLRIMLQSFEDRRLGRCSTQMALNLQRQTSA